MQHKLYCSLLGLALFSSCAERRKTEKVLDFDDNRFAKSTVLSSDMWKYKATVVDVSNSAGLGIVGGATNLQVGRFEFGRDKLNFYNVVTPYADGGKGDLPELINSWDIQHSEYRLREVNGKVSNVEEENNKIPWKDKNFFKIDYTSAAVDSVVGQTPCWGKLQDELVEGSQEFTEQHLSFVVESTYELLSGSPSCSSFADLNRRINAGNFTGKIRVKHSFAPYSRNPDYKPLAYQDEFDSRRPKFGFFETIVDRLNDETGRFERSILANRWDPNKQHTIHFAEDFPDEYKWIYNLCWKESLAGGESYEACKKQDKSSIQSRTNSLFAKHGLAVRFDFVNDPAVSFGDVRYSFVKFVDDQADGAPLGYGPSDVDPLTGEILRSDSVVWTAGLKSYIERIRLNETQVPQRFENIFFEKLVRVFEDAKLAGKGPQDWLSTAQAFMSRTDLLTQHPQHGAGDIDEQEQRVANRLELGKLINKNRFANPYYAGFTRGDNAFDAVRVDYEPIVASQSIDRALKLMEREHRPMSLQAQEQLRYLSQATKKLQHQRHAHQHTLKPWLKNLPHNTTVFPLEEQLSSVSSQLLSAKTDQQIIDTILYRVAIHEFGHNLNLRHNFYGSVDYSNFDGAEEQVDRDGKVLVKDGKPLKSESLSSSVMDYLTINDDVNTLHKWEAYDEAALVYAYSGGDIDLSQVRLVNGKHQVRSAPKNYLYCTDEHAGWDNPFCNRFDRGTTASEIVFSYIESYDRAYKIRNRPFGRAYWDASYYSDGIVGALLEPYKFLALYEDIDNWFFRVNSWSQYVDAGKEDQFEKIQLAVKDDVTRAATLLAGFYASIVKFAEDANRPDNDDIDEFSGNLRIKGISFDKLVAMYGLAGSFPIAIDNSGYAYQTNFLSHLGAEDSLGAVVRKELVNIAVEKVFFTGYDFIGLGRSLFLDTATIDPANMDLGYIDRMQIQCYTKAGLRQAFGIDANAFYPHVPGRTDALEGDALVNNLVNLEAAKVRLGGVNQAQVGAAHYPVNPGFEGTFSAAETVNAVVVRINQNYYLAKDLGQDAGYAYEFMTSRIEDDSMTVAAANYILASKNAYDYVKYGGVQECMDYQYYDGE